MAYKKPSPPPKCKRCQVEIITVLVSGTNYGASWEKRCGCKESTVE